MTPSRPTLHTLAVALHALWGGVTLFLGGLLGSLAGAGALIAGLVAVSGEDDAVPAMLVLGLVSVAMLLVAASGALALVLAAGAWRMKRAWIWALLVWSILHASTACGLLAILTAIGSFQALDRLREDAA